MPRSMNSSGVSGPKYTKKNASIDCLAHRLSAFTSKRGTDTAGRWALEPPPEDLSAQIKLFDRQFQSRESHTKAETRRKQPQFG